jgi:hypothetical protein
LAQRDGISRRYIRRLVNLAFLSPQLVEAILQGRQPVELTTTRLTELSRLSLGDAFSAALSSGAETSAWTSMPDPKSGQLSTGSKPRLHFPVAPTGQSESRQGGAATLTSPIHV